MEENIVEQIWEIKNFCKQFDDCSECPLYLRGYCYFGVLPEEWDEIIKETRVIYRIGDDIINV